MDNSCDNKCANPNDAFGSYKLPTPTEIEQALFYKVTS